MDDEILLEDAVEAGRLVSLAEVREMLEAAQGKRENLTYEQKIALEHAMRFARTDSKAAEGIVAGVRKKFPELEPRFAYKLADLVPQHPDDVRSILQKSGLDLSDEDCEGVLEIIDKFYVA